MHEHALRLIDALQKELDHMPYRDPAGSYSLGQMHQRQIDQLRAHVECHREWMRAEEVRMTCEPLSMRLPS